MPSTSRVGQSTPVCIRTNAMMRCRCSSVTYTSRLLPVSSRTTYAASGACGLLRSCRSGAGLSALSGASSTVCGDSRASEAVITSLSPEQTSPEALGALGLQIGAQPVALVPQRPRLFFEGRLRSFGQLQLRPQVCSLRARLDYLGGEVADEFREVFRIRGLLAGFVRMLPRRLPRVAQGVERVYIYTVGFLYTLSLYSSHKESAPDVRADGARIYAEGFRGDPRGHPPGFTRAISACVALSHCPMLYPSEASRKPLEVILEALVGFHQRFITRRYHRGCPTAAIDRRAGPFLYGCRVRPGHPRASKDEYAGRVPTKKPGPQIAQGGDHGK